MTHARTLPRYVGAAGLVAGLLVAFPSLAFEKVHISNVTVGGSTPTTINAYVNARYQYSPFDSRRYYRWQVPVAKSTLRAGALSALGRGVMHPGFQIAVVAAGFVISEGIIYKEEETDWGDISQFQQYDDNFGALSWRGRISTSIPMEYHPTILSSALSALSYYQGIRPDGDYHLYKIEQLAPLHYRITLRGVHNGSWNHPNYTVLPDYDIEPTHSIDYGVVEVPVTQEDLATVDQHIPPQLLEELWADLKPDVTTRPFTITPQTYPEPWYNQLDVSTLPLSQLSTTGTPAPEVVTHVAKQMENLDAQMEGREKPHPSVTVAPGASADEEMLDRWDEPVPDFVEVTPEWQVETIDELPSFDIGIGSGQCPPPTDITLPFPLNSTLTLNWQPFCDLAAMIRGAVIAVAMILSLYIVLRRG